MIEWNYLVIDWICVLIEGIWTVIGMVRVVIDLFCEVIVYLGGD